MSGKRVAIGARPVVDPAAHAWVRNGEDGGESSSPKAEVYTARLTVDITGELRGRIKVRAFQRGLTVADMLRELLESEYGGSPEGAP